MIEKIKAIAAFNAMEHGGKADLNSVISRTIAYFPGEKRNLKTLIPKIKSIIEEVDALTIDEMKTLVNLEFPELLQEKKVEEKRLPDLPDVPKGGVVMRLAPSPSGPLHIGHARMAILNDEYYRRYGGKLILRIEDTNPANIELAAYQMIQDDLKWLDVNFTDLVIQSERFGLYYEVMRKLIEDGKAYVSVTRTEEFKRRLQAGVAVKEREDPPEDNLQRWEKMLDGSYSKGEAYVVIKTDLDHPNPAIRDFISFRIIDQFHPLQGEKYRVYPMMNFSVAVDDHYLSLTHVIRGKDHLANTEKQRYIFDYLGWKVPYYIHYGKVSIENSVLKTTLIKKGIKSGEFSGWDDPKLGTLLALKKRGFDPRTVRKYWIESGIRDVDITFSWDIFYAFNRQIIDRESPRHFFVVDPVELDFNYQGKLKARIPRFPFTDSDYREYVIGQGKIMISKQDYLRLKGEVVRLKDLGNFRIDDGKIVFIDNSVERIKEKVQIIHWLAGNAIPFKVYKPDGSVDSGFVESDAANYIGRVHQMERYGYVNVVNEKEGYFTHP
jgi:glutamyl-tRNA synthetase